MARISQQPLRSAPREKSIVDAIRKWVNAQPGAHARKTHGGQYGGGGWPDVVACYGGVLLMLEVKRPGGSGATDLQRRELSAWYDAGAVAAVVRSLDHVRYLFAQVDEDEGRPGLARMSVDVCASWEIR